MNIGPLIECYLQAQWDIQNYSQTYNLDEWLNSGAIN